MICHFCGHELIQKDQTALDATHYCCPKCQAHAIYWWMSRDITFTKYTWIDSKTCITERARINEKGNLIESSIDTFYSKESTKEELEKMPKEKDFKVMPMISPTDTIFYIKPLYE